MKRILQLSYFWFISVYILAAAAFYGNHSLIFPVVTVLFTMLAVFWFLRGVPNMGLVSSN